MKLFVTGVLIVAAAGLLMAAAPTETEYGAIVGSKTVDSLLTNGYQGIDSVIVVASDSANVFITVTGVAVFSQGDKLYLGLGADSANRVSESDTHANSNLYTWEFVPPFKVLSDVAELVKLPFSVQYVKTNNGALTDTIYFNAARGPNSTVALEDVVIQVQVCDKPFVAAER